ncbi:MAG: class C sortase [Firmicutes bacterium]|nr:class C sortase [Bacillota bacterium]
MGKWLKKHFITIVLVAILLTGAGLLAYPSIANYWNSFHQTQAIMSYSDQVSSMSTEDYEKILKDARAYNRRLGETGIQWNLTEEQRAEYNSKLKIEGSDVMAYVSIPKIHVKLPIYHGTDESVLQTSIGHLEPTSLPVGGKSSHCSISGHRGLPSARLFTDISRLKEGDTWTITVLNETLTYEVDQIRIVEPTDLSNLTIEEGKDYCTLITCTPYGINTHRLLVRGHRIPNADGDANLTADAIQIEPIYIAPFLAAPILLALLVMLVITTRRARKNDTEKRISRYLRDKEL